MAWRVKKLYQNILLPTAMLALASALMAKEQDTSERSRTPSRRSLGRSGDWRTTTAAGDWRMPAVCRWRRRRSRAAAVRRGGGGARRWRQWRGRWERREERERQGKESAWVGGLCGCRWARPDVGVFQIVTY
jgi:hypothetical protein